MAKAAKAAAAEQKAQLDERDKRIAALEEELRQREEGLQKELQERDAALGDRENALGSREEGLGQKEQELADKEAEIAARLEEVTNREAELAARELEQLQRDMEMPELAEGSGARRQRDETDEKNSSSAANNNNDTGKSGSAAPAWGNAEAKHTGPIHNADFSAANARLMDNAASVCGLWSKGKCFRGSICMFKHEGPGGVTDEAPTPEMAKAFDRATMCLYYACGGGIGCTQRTCPLHHCSKADLTAIARNELRAPTYDDLMSARRAAGVRGDPRRGGIGAARGTAGVGGGCFTCGGDHLARDCPKAPSKTGCFNCGGDHIARDCTKPRGGPRFGAPVGGGGPAPRDSQRDRWDRDGRRGGERSRTPPRRSGGGGRFDDDRRRDDRYDDDRRGGGRDDRRDDRGGRSRSNDRW